MAQRIQFRNDTLANWTAANPVLAAGELGLESDTRFYKIGDGITPWNDLPYAVLRTLDSIQVAEMGDQATPAVPGPGKLKFYAKSLGGRMMLRQIGPSGLSTPLQPSFFQNSITFIGPSATTALSAIGNSVTSVGTISHPNPSEAYGYMANIASAATVNTTAGTGTASTLWLRGGLGGGGFFFATRAAFPDAGHNETGIGTGTRIFTGMTSLALSAAVASNSPAGHHAGFQRLHVNASTLDENWFFLTGNGVNNHRIDTGLPFLPGKIYDAYIFCPPSGNVISWRIDNLTDDLTASGETSTHLPASDALLRAGIQFQTVNAVVRNLRLQRIYIESDR
jgi:hypothetical protein